MGVIEQKNTIRCHYALTRMIRLSRIEDADLSGFRNLTGLRSEHQHLVGCHRPFAQQSHVAGLHSLDESLRPDPAGLETRCSGRDLAAAGDGLQHALDVVVTLRRFLAGDRAVHAVTNQEDAHLGLGPLNQIQREAQRIVGAFVAIWRVVDDEKIVQPFGLSS
jgi:hypothetical protein